MQTERETEVLLGSLLGDGAVGRGYGHTIASSAKHLDYLEWKREQLLSMNPSEIKTKGRYDPRHGKIYYTSRFYIGKQRPWRERFYLHGIKIVPRDLILTPLAFAVWFLDDGGCVNRSSFSLATNGFDKDSREIAAAALRKLGLECRCTDDARIYLPASTKAKVLEWVGPIITPSMAHKIDLRKDAVFNKEIRPCEVCGNEFEWHPSGNIRTCSPECGLQIRQGGYSTRSECFTCARCGKDALRYNKRQTKCTSCKKLRITPIPCLVCGNAVHHEERETCSVSCGAVIGHTRRV